MSNNSLLNRDNLTQPILMQLSQKLKTFSQFFSAFLKCILNFGHFQKKMTLIADVFQNFENYIWLDNYLKSGLRGPFEKQHGKRAETFWKSQRQHVYQIFWSLTRQLSWENSVLEKLKILTLFVNTSSADDKYSLLNRDNLTEPIQI